MSLRLKLTLWYTALLAILVIGFAVVHYYVVKYSVTNEMQSQLSSRANDLATSVAWNSKKFNITNSFQWSQLEYKIYSDYSIMIQIIDAQANVLARSENLIQADKFLPKEFIQNNTLSNYIIESEFDKSPFYTLYHPYVDNGKLLGWIQVGAFESRITSFLEMLKQWMLYSVPLGLLMSVVFGYYLSKKALAPIDSILVITDQIDSSHLNIRVPEFKNETIEVKKLASTLNSLLNRLALSFSRMSDLTSDASHELLTPLTAMMGNIDVTLRRQRPVEEYEEALAKIRKDCNRMVETIRSLLFLARSEPPYELKLEVLTIDQVIQEEIDNLIPLIAQNSLTIEYYPAVSFQAAVNQSLFRQLVINILSNSIKYSNPGGNITVSIDKSETEFQIKVKDQGCGIPKESIPRLFDRFYRVDGSRQRKTGGTGLGLAIVKRIIDLHQGTIQFESDVNIGTEVTISIPFIDENEKVVAASPPMIAV